MLFRFLACGCKDREGYPILVYEVSSTHTNSVKILAIKLCNLSLTIDGLCSNFAPFEEVKVPVTNSAEFFGKKCHLEDFGGFGVVRVKKEQKKKFCQCM